MAQPAPDVVVDVAAEFAYVMRTPLTSSRQRYLRELVAITRAAAIGGEYRDAIKGYEVIGKVLGHVTDTQQHLHMHAATAGSWGLVDRSDAELVELMSAPVLPAPAAAPEPTPDELEAFLADLA